MDAARRKWADVPAERFLTQLKDHADLADRAERDVAPRRGGLDPATADRAHFWAQVHAHSVDTA